MCGLIAVASLVAVHRPEGSQSLWCVGLIALQHVESFLSRDQIHVPCIGRWILNYWTTREVLALRDSYNPSHLLGRIYNSLNFLLGDAIQKNSC